MKAAHPDQPLEEWWFQDEARIGQQGTLTHVWAETGSRPQRIRQTEYEGEDKGGEDKGTSIFFVGRG